MRPSVCLGSIRRKHHFSNHEKLELQSKFHQKLELYHLSAEHLNIRWIEKQEADTVEYICFIRVSEKLIELEGRENLRKVISSNLWFERDTNK